MLETLNKPHESALLPHPQYPSKSSAIIFVALTLLVALVYGNSLFYNDLVYGDEYLIAGNVLIKSIDNLPKVFVSEWWSGTERPVLDKRYRPLVVATFVLNYAADGSRPWSYHLVNLILHAVVTLSLYVLLARLGWPYEGAVIAAVIFAVHPLHTEAVSVIGNRTELMMAAGVLISLWSYIRGHRALSLIAFLCALLSKEQAVVLPGLLLLADICARRNTNLEGHPVFPLPKAASRYAPYLMLLAAYLALRAWALGAFQPPGEPFHSAPLEHVTGLQWLYSTVKYAGYYLWLWIWPARLIADYSYNTLPLATSVADAGVLWSLLAWGGLIGLALRYRRRYPQVFFAVGLTVLAFLPASNFAFSIGTSIAERLFYLPSVGLCSLAGFGCGHLLETYRRRAGTMSERAAGAVYWGLLCSFIVIGLLLGGRTIARNQDYATHERFYRTLVTDAPENAKAHELLGNYLLLRPERAQWTEALVEYRSAERIYPDLSLEDASFPNSVGRVLLQLGDVDESIRWLKLSTAVAPKWNLAYYYLGLAYATKGMYEEGEQALRQSLAIQDQVPGVRAFLSELLINQGRYAEGLKESEAILERHPDFLKAHLTRAKALEGLHRDPDAVKTYEFLLVQPLPQPIRSDIDQRLRRLRARMSPGTSTEPVKHRLRAGAPCYPGALSC